MTMKPLPLLGVASAPAVKQYLQQAQQEGLESEPILHAAGITPDVLKDNGAHIHGEQFQAILKVLIECSSNPLFGLQSAQFVQASSYSVLGFISMNCLTLGEAIERIMPFERLVGDMGVSALTVLPNQLAQLSWQCRYTESSVIPHMVDNVLASWLQFARLLIGDALSPSIVKLRRSAPQKLQFQQEYQQVFGCDVAFDAEIDALVFPAAFQQIPIQSGNSVLRQALETHAKQLLSELEASHKQPFTALVTQYIQQGLAIKQYRQQDIAVMLNMSIKTLQRRLKLEQTSYQSLLDTIRHQRATDLLSNSSLSIEKISELLGFNDVRSFYHHFNRREGITPAQFRKNAAFLM